MLNQVASYFEPLNTPLFGVVWHRMETDNLSRRQMLSRLGLTAVAGTMAGVAPVSAADAPARPPSAMTLKVQDFGAAGDGKTDDTEAFRATLKAAESGNGAVFVPRGRYLIGGHLDVPPHVMLEGIFRGPSASGKDQGSVLLSTVGAGDVNGQPFITLHQGSTLRGLSVFYPEQKMKNPPVPYPWTVRGQGDNISLLDVLLVNPYQAVDFGTEAAGRHYINGLCG